MRLNCRTRLHKQTRQGKWTRHVNQREKEENKWNDKDAEEEEKEKEEF